MMKILLSLALGASVALSAQANEPRRYQIEKNSVTTSGLSSGAAIAVQFHVAHSDWIQGIAALASAPYYCARNSLRRGFKDCINKEESEPVVEELITYAKIVASEQKIAATANMKNDKVWLFVGSLDSVVARPVNDAVWKFYSEFVAEDNISYITDQPFEHTMPTLDIGGDCSKTQSPFISDCDYDAAGMLLNYLYSSMQAPSDKLSGEILAFDQRKITGTPYMGEQAFAYVPKSCAEGESCKLHISFHGCKQNVDMIGQAYVRDVGFNRWADSNNMIVLYPQAQKSSFNPYGCWDWWGYSGDDYALRSGKQIQGVKALVNAISIDKF